ncbi:MAG: transporter ATP-binding protein [Microbacteriaceae bacterium]|nr:transporter ATP-binding protein [Microbacteriaceae bacterium]
MSNTGPRRGPGGGGPMGMAQGPAAKSLTFGPSAKRLLGRLVPERGRIVLIFLLTIVSVFLTVLGPRLLGNAINLVFDGAISAQLPAGATKAQIISGLRAQGNNQQADLLSGMTLTPGHGIDFTAVGNILVMLLFFYVLSSVFSYLQGFVLNGVVQRTVYRLRSDVEAKINRLPLKYFDGMQRGELLSRVTNDIDNISTSLQQTISQLLTSLLSVVGVLIFMFLISPILAVVALVTIPLTILITTVIAKRSQKLFVAQWKNTGELNGLIEETYTGHALVKVFGRHREVEEQFAIKNEQLFRASFGAQFVSGIIMPAMMFVGNLVYVVIAVVGGLFVASGSLGLGDVTAFIQYPGSSPSRSPSSAAWPTCCSRAWPRPSASSSFWMPTTSRQTRRQCRRPALPPRGASPSTTSRSATRRSSRSSSTCPWWPNRARRSRSWVRRERARRRW